MVVGEIVRSILKREKVTQERLAFTLNERRETINQKLSRNEIDNAMLVAVSELTKIPYDKIIEEIEREKSPELDDFIVKSKELEDRIKDLENEIKVLKTELAGKDKLLEGKDALIKSQANQIAKDDLIIEKVLKRKR